MIEIKDLVLRVAGRVLLENASAVLPERGKIGFVGRNGAGKTTLLKTLQGIFPYESGEIGFTKDSELKYVKQEIDDVSLSPLAYLIKEAAIEDDDDFKLERQIEAQGAKILRGLGFTTETMMVPLSELSGGWRMRVMLACILIGRPGILLLDEPTNHLDLEAVVWLKSHLKNYQGTILLVSHDKTLLNDVCDHILHLEDKKLFFYTGNYDRFSRLRSEKMTHLQAAQRKIDERREHMQSFVNRFGATASKAKQAQSRVKALSKLENVYVPLDSSSFEISFPHPTHLPVPLISTYNCAFGYEEDKPILKRISMRIDPGDRIAILGQNGNGKTTFANYLAGLLPFQNGEKTAAYHLKVGYFYQHQIDVLDLSKTAVELLEEKIPKASAVDLRNQLARFGLEANKAITPLKNLSGGEKARLNLALMCALNPNMIILDEPTNHLDMDTKEALGDALMDFEGAVIIISHDQEFLEKVVDQIWIAENKTISVYEGTLEDYEKEVLSKTQDKPQKQEKEEKIKQQKPSKNMVNIEKKLEQLQRRKSQIEEKIANPDFYILPQKDQQKANKEYQDVLSSIKTLEEEWLES